jgi:hypothetical protein
MVEDLAGAAIALQLICLHQAPSESGLAPLIVGRAVSSAVTLAAAGVMCTRLGEERPSLALSATAGVLDSPCQPVLPARGPQW